MAIDEVTVEAVRALPSGLAAVHTAVVVDTGKRIKARSNAGFFHAAHDAFCDVSAALILLSRRPSVIFFDSDH
jgi:hypothetical protein